MNEESIANEEPTKPTPPKKYYDYISVGNRTKQIGYFVQQHDKNRMFAELLQNLTEKQILVFVKSKKSADSLKKYLFEKDIDSLAVHGNHRASQIEDGQKSFNSKESKILITTDRIFEGMTLSDVDVVINFDLPLEAPDYFKRLRLVDEIGLSISFIDPEDERMLATIELMMKCEMVEEEIKGFAHTNGEQTQVKDKIKKPRHKKVQQRAKRKAEIKSQWVPSK